MNLWPSTVRNALGCYPEPGSEVTHRLVAIQHPPRRFVLEYCFRSQLEGFIARMKGEDESLVSVVRGRADIARWKQGNKKSSNVMLCL
jgi:hypothetical protein